MNLTVTGNYGTDSEVKTNYITVPPPPPASITITSPNGGETWQRYTSHAVTWDYTGNPGSAVKIVLLKGGIEVGTIAASVPIGTGGKGSYTWPIYYGTPGSDFKVSVQSISQPTIKDVSNNYFTITTTTPASSITVTSPNGGETWQRYTSHAVTWDYTGSPGSAVKIVLLKGGIEVGTIAASVPIGTGGKGSYTWPIYYGTPGSDFKVSVQSISQPTIKDVSNNYFNITTTTTASSITVTSPNGGESWDRSISHTITWAYSGSLGSTVKIVLLKAGTEVGTIVSSAPIGTGGKGSYVWTSYSGRVPGSDYKVSVQSISQPAIKDVSDNYFTVTSGTVTPTITVTSPNGGETWQRYTSHTVTWDYTGSPGSAVKIVLLKSGTEVGTIATSVPIGTGGKGSYTWPIYYGTPGSDFKVSVQSISQPTIKDVSNNYFTITT